MDPLLVFMQAGWDEAPRGYMDTSLRVAIDQMLGRRGHSRADGKPGILLDRFSPCATAIR